MNLISQVLLFSSSGAAFWFLPSGMEWKLCPPETAGLYPTYNAWAYINPVPQQSKPHNGPPPPPWRSPALPAHLTVLPAVWSSGHGCTRGPPPGFPCCLPPRSSAHLQHLPPGSHCASGHSGHQPPTAALPHFAPPGPIQASLSPTFLHCLARLCQFSSQPHKNKPVPLHLSMAAQVPFIPPEG